MATKATELELVAFWRHDAFPYILGGHVTRMREDGAVETREYGPGFWFSPVKVLPRDAGESALRDVVDIRAEHDAAARSNAKVWADRLRVVFPWAP